MILLCNFYIVNVCDERFYQISNVVLYNIHIKWGRFPDGSFLLPSAQLVVIFMTESAPATLGI